MPMGRGAGSAPAGVSTAAGAPPVAGEAGPPVVGAATPSASCSSPDSYISVTMSAPPISSPSTNSCGIVGQLDRADSSWRMRGSGRMSTAANGAPVAWIAATVRAEKPHAGISGVPFMKRMTRFSWIASEMASRRGFSVCSDMGKETLLRGVGLHAQRVDGAADLALEHIHDKAMLLDAAQAGERRRDHGGAEVVAAARPILHLGAGLGDGGLDALLDLVGA